MPSDEVINATLEALKKRNIEVILVNTKEDALAKVKELIPKGKEVMNGSSTTLIEIGFNDYLKAGEHGWNNLHDAMFKEEDKEKQGELRRKSVTAEYFIASANAIAQTGEILATDASGSRVGAFLFAAQHLVLVSGVNKIVPTLEDGLQRIKDFAFPLENARAQKAYNMGSMLGKTAILSGEMMPGRTTVILVKELLGY